MLLNEQVWTRMRDLPPPDLQRIKWLLETAREEMIAGGAAVKYGACWFINRERLPEFLGQHTLAKLGRNARAARLPRTEEAQHADRHEKTAVARARKRKRAAAREPRSKVKKRGGRRAVVSGG
jgi:hypothetical protein